MWSGICRCGTGKPEPLGGNLSGWRSRRINREHRLVYRVTGKGEGQALEVAGCWYHYFGCWSSATGMEYLAC